MENEEKESALKFGSCRSYKMGIYVFNIYLKRDFLFLCACFVLVILLLNTLLADPQTNLFAAAALAIGILGCAFLITYPVPYYHALYFFIFYMIRFYLTAKSYMWKGKVFQTDENEEETE